MCNIVLRHHHQTGRLLVETVDDAGAQRGVDAGENIAVMKQGVDERAGVIAVRRVCHHACGFVDDEELVVFVDDFERDVLRDGFGPGRTGKSDVKNFARCNGVTWFHAAAVDEHQPCFDSLLDFVTGGVLDLVGQVDVEAFLGLLGRDNDAELFSRIRFSVAGHAQEDWEGVEEPAPISSGPDFIPSDPEDGAPSATRESSG